jgi:hypothetical protein
MIYPLVVRPFGLRSTVKLLLLDTIVTLGIDNNKDIYLHGQGMTV